MKKGCGVCGGFIRSYELNCVACSGWARRIFERLGTQLGTKLMHRLENTWVMR